MSCNKNKALKEYRRVMKTVDLPQDSRERIVNYCAKYATVKKLRNNRFVIKFNVVERNLNS